VLRDNIDYNITEMECSNREVYLTIDPSLKDFNEK